MALSKIPSAGFQDNVKFRNIIINGDMSLAQRGTSATTLALSSGGFRYNDVDRFAVNAGNVSSGQVSTQQIDSGLTGFPKAKRITVTTAEASPSADGYLSIGQNVEAQNLQYLKFGTSDALALTLSFYVRSSVTGNYAGNIIQLDNSARVFVFNFTINSANTWEKKTISILADASGLINNDNGIGFEINLPYLYLGSNYNNGTLNAWNTNSGANEYSNSATRVNLLATSGATFDITAVQLEAGTTASSFETLPTDINLMRCQRYFYKSFNQGTAPAQNVSAGNTAMTGSQVNYVTSFFFPTKMRAVPSITTYNPYAANSSFRQFNSNNDFSCNPNVISDDKVGWFNTTNFSGTILLHGHLTADAEL
jgi:hypothetical protein